MEIFSPSEKSIATMKLILLLLFLKPIFSSKCQQISIPMCKGIGYNFTKMPNSFNHENQDEAGLEVHQYWPLVEIKCSPDLRFFICSMYVPICLEDYGPAVPVCRSVCLRAKAGCEPVMNHYNFVWPARFGCANFPPFGPNSICMDERRGELPPVADCSCQCKKPLVKSNQNLLHLKNCSLPCQLYPGNEKFADVWLTTWAILTALVSLITMATFCISERFTYPERPIVWLCFCYLMISVGYLIRGYYGHGISCDGNVTKWTFSRDLCSLVFFLVYFFSMAAGGWFLSLSFSWYLAASLKWGSEAIAKKNLNFHLVSWSVATVLTTLASQHITGDPISGICFVGDEGVLAFVLLPWGILLGLGSCFLLGGFIELFRIRKVISKSSGKTEKLEKLIFRIGVFSILYTLPASAVIGAGFYENNAKNEFVGGVCGCEGAEKPIYSVVMIKHFLTLAIGMTTGLVYLWSNKTLETWKAFFCCHDVVSL